MALHYVEFDTTQQALLADLRTQILLCSDWERIGSDTALALTSAATAAAATSVPVPSPAAAGLTVGQVVTIDDGTLREYRTITAVAASAITVAALTFAHASGVSIRPGAELYKATTTRGAPMVVDLAEAHPDMFRLTIAFYRNHVGGVATDKSAPRYLYWRPSGGAATHLLHVTLSLSKEHFFLSIEGPRGSEVGALSGTLGSLRNYAFISDLVPYDLSDTNPVVVHGASATASADASVANLNLQAYISRNLADTAAWGSAKLLSLTPPSSGSGISVNPQRARAVDGKYVLAPYVAFADDTGMRGRLSSFFYAGNTQTDSWDIPPPPVGTKVEHQGAWYKLLAVTKSEGARDCYGAFGAASQATATVSQRSICVAVPCLP